eukprot:31051-Pelagococcus_subviridis.AAC.1
MFGKGGGLGSLFGSGKKPADQRDGASSAARSPPAGVVADLARRGESSASATTTTTTTTSSPRPSDIADDDLPAILNRAEDLLEKTRKRCELGARTPEEEGRQFLRVNEVKRLLGRARSAAAKLPPPDDDDDDASAAWRARLVVLDAELASAVEAVVGGASPAPTPRAEAPRAEASTSTSTRRSEGGLFAGMTVSPIAPASALGGALGTGGDLFSGLEVSAGGSSPAAPAAAAAAAP